MEYPKPKRKLFKLPKRPPLYLRYPRAFIFSSMSISLLIFYSHPIYEFFNSPSSIHPDLVDEETRHKMLFEGYVPPNIEELREISKVKQHEKNFFSFFKFGSKS